MDEYGPGSPAWELTDEIRTAITRLVRSGEYDAESLIKFIKDSLNDPENWADD